MADSRTEEGRKQGEPETSCIRKYILKEGRKDVNKDTEANLNKLSLAELGQLELKNK